MFLQKLMLYKFYLLKHQDYLIHIVISFPQIALLENYAGEIIKVYVIPRHR